MKVGDISKNASKGEGGFYEKLLLSGSIVLFSRKKEFTPLPKLGTEI